MVSPRKSASFLLSFIAALLFMVIAAGVVSAASAPSTNSTRELASLTLGAKTFTCANNGVGASAPSCALPFLASQTVFITCADPDGCTIVPSETDAWDGFLVKLVNVGTNAATIADSAGVTELTAAAALGQWDTLSITYAVDRFVEIARANN